MRRPITAGSFEEKIDALLKGKRGLFERNEAPGDRMTVAITRKP